MHPPEPMRDDCRQSLALEVLREYGEIRISVLGLSMLPSFWPADILTIRVISLDDCGPGDVVLCESKNRLIVHRIVRETCKRGERFLITRGDAQSHEDNPISARQLCGRVIAVERAGRVSPVSPLYRKARLAGLLLGSSARVRSLALRIRTCSRGETASEMEMLRSVDGSM